jgi:hypothetical protein
MSGMESERERDMITNVQIEHLKFMISVMVRERATDAK